MNKATFTLRGRNPDVLSCIANLSNDEVFTPPEFANRMLDTLAKSWAADNEGASIWADPSVRFFDPCAKSGVFLREITKRLMEGLEPRMPEVQERVDHILTQQVYGIGITELTAMLSRRSLYCSKHANGPHSITRKFNSESGNVWFERVEHTWEKPNEKDKGKCIFCGASSSMLDRGDDRESHAYAFIHTKNIRERVSALFGGDMQFDVIIGNPPYQLETAGHGNQAKPIYQLFVQQAKELEPKHIVMVTPSRWFSGGMGLNDFRASMLSDRSMQKIVDYPKLYEGFPGVKIRGGISYFLWNREYSGPCEIQTMWDGEPTGPSVARYLDEFDIFVRRNEAIPILKKVLAAKEAPLSRQVSSQRPFGIATNFKGATSPNGMRDPVHLHANQKIIWIEKEQINTNVDWVDKWKVLMTRIQGTSAAVETKFLSKPIVTGPQTACTETYIVAGVYDTEQEAKYLAQYLTTRFARFLVSLRKPTQDALRHVYGFIPAIPLNSLWTDEKLYERYGLSEEEIAFIESQVASQEMDFDNLADD